MNRPFLHNMIMMKMVIQNHYLNSQLYELSILEYKNVNVKSKYVRTHELGLTTQSCFCYLL